MRFCRFDRRFAHTFASQNRKEFLHGRTTGRKYYCYRIGNLAWLAAERLLSQIGFGFQPPLHQLA